jgi:Tol biopolymer transport system component
VPVNLVSINTPFQDTGPHLSRDGHLLFFNSSRPGGSGSIDVWVSRRENIHDDFAWEAPVNLGAPLNSTIFDGGVSIWGPELYFWRGTPNPNTAPTDGDIYMSKKTGQTFSEPALVPELNSPELNGGASHDQRPSIRFDGREIFLSSDRPGGAGLEDIWASVRQGNGKSWEVPVNLGSAVNSSCRDTQPALSEDGTMLFFLSDRQGCSGNLDIYVATRTVSPQE